MAPQRTQPPRPPNSWMCFRSDFIKRRRKEYPVEESARELSTLASGIWRKAGEEFKRKWAVVAERKKIQHMLLFPDYKYQPQKKEDKEREKTLKAEEKKRAKNGNSKNNRKSPKALRGVERGNKDIGNDSIADVHAVEQPILVGHGTAVPSSYFLQWHSATPGHDSSSPATLPSSEVGSPASLPSNSLLQCRSRDDHYPSSPSPSSTSCDSHPPDSLYSVWTPSSTSSSLPDEDPSGGVEGSAVPQVSDSYSLPSWMAPPASNGPIHSSTTYIDAVNDFQSPLDFQTPPACIWDEAQVLAALIPPDGPYDPDPILSFRLQQDSVLLRHALEVQKYEHSMSTTALKRDDEVEVRVGNKRVKAEAVLKKYRTSPSPFFYPSPGPSPVLASPSGFSISSDDSFLHSPGGFNSFGPSLSAQLPPNVDVTVGNQEVHIKEEPNNQEEMAWAYSGSDGNSQDRLLWNEDDFILQAGQELVLSEDVCTHESFDSPFFQSEREDSSEFDDEMDWLDPPFIRD